jgi:hypothetical protein
MPSLPVTAQLSSESRATQRNPGDRLQRAGLASPPAAAAVAAVAVVKAAAVAAVKAAAAAANRRSSGDGTLNARTRGLDSHPL